MQGNSGDRGYKMASICIYFQLHQPYRLRSYSVFDSDSNYFDNEINGQIVHEIANRSYLPTTQLILDLVRRHEGQFRVAYSLTGSLIEQLDRHQPQVVKRLEELAATGCVEFLSETYHHSLSFLYSRDEFHAQVQMHKELIQSRFDQTPRVFRNTELIYSNELADDLHLMGGYHGVLTEGPTHILQGRSAHCLYHPPAHKLLKLLVKNHQLSDDIAFRFSDQKWTEWPLTAEKFVGWLDRTYTQGPVCNLFLNYETFGEHQRRESGIFDFLEELPTQVLAHGKHQFNTPSDCIDAYEVVDEYDVPHMISWADSERDLSAWLGNAMQSNALHELYQLEGSVKESGDEAILADWRKLTTSDHFYYMCTKYFSDGDVHSYFNPYESPYDSYINFMNVLDNIRTRVEAIPSYALAKQG